MAQRDAAVATDEAAPVHPAVWVGAVVLLVGLTVAWALLPVKEWLEGLTEWVRGLGVLGLMVFMLVYVAITIVLAPAEVMSIAAGVLFGAWGIPVVVIAATLGASLAFLVSRYLLHDKVQALTRKWPVFEAVDKAVCDEDWKIVLLLRLNPLVPFGLQNYFFGVTDIQFWRYAMATFFGIMPGAALYVYLGILGHAAAGQGGGGAGKMAFLAAGLIVTAITVFFLARTAKRKLKELGMSRAS